jgi:hypothetical protein
VKSRGKVSVRRAKGMKAAAPIVCERAGGRWMGWDAPIRCVDARCERCGKYDSWAEPLAMCHIQGRGRQGDESPENLAVLCPSCHDLLDHGDADVREALRDKLREKIGGKHD